MRLGRLIDGVILILWITLGTTTLIHGVINRYDYAIVWLGLIVTSLRCYVHDHI